MTSDGSKRNPNLDGGSGDPAAPPPSNDPLFGPRSDGWWTGPRPPSGAISSLPLPDLARCTRREVLDYFDNTWALTEVLFAALQGEAAFVRPPYHRLRHPMIFYYAHPAVFYVNKLRIAGLVGEALNADYESRFESGVDEMSWDDLSRGEIGWPPVASVTAYRREAYAVVRRIIEAQPGLDEDHAPVGFDSPLWALFMAFEHERIHLELSSVLMRELPLECVRRPSAWPALHPSARAPSAPVPRAGVDYPAPDFATIDGGHVVIGKPQAWPSFGWDNEYGARTVEVHRFSAGRHLVSNGAFSEFVRVGGYGDRRFFSDEGWRWRSYRNAKWPTFWVPDGPAGLHRYKLRALFEVIDMPWAWPVEVNFHEAQAYTAWASQNTGTHHRLITEAEHHLLRAPRAATPSGHDEPARRSHNAELRHGSPGPVEAFPASRSGCHDVFGNLWQWCEDHFHPLDDFAPHPLYDDFSVPCFDGQHQMILGGSFISTGDEASFHARFHFRSHFFQHAGFRLARGVADAPDGAVRLGGAARSGASVYETRALVDQYLLFHFGAREDQLAFPSGIAHALDFPSRTAALVLELTARLGIPRRRALDLGCAVGGASFALARGFGEVVGVDLSAAFIAVAEALARDGEARCFRHDEGELGREAIARVPRDIDRRLVRFERGDAAALPTAAPFDRGFDAVLIANLLCRLTDPNACLAQMGGARGLVAPGGLLVVTSPYTWMAEHTPRDRWLGGFVADDREVRGVDGLRAALGGDFDLVAEHDLPLVLREHARKYQYVVAHATAWRRRSAPP